VTGAAVQRLTQSLLSHGRVDLPARGGCKVKQVIELEEVLGMRERLQKGSTRLGGGDGGLRAADLGLSDRVPLAPTNELPEILLEKGRGLKP
jgi:hypothetical protein